MLGWQPEREGCELSRSPAPRHCWRQEGEGLEEEMGLRAEEQLEPLGVCGLVGKGNQEMLLS